MTRRKYEFEVIQLLQHGMPPQEIAIALSVPIDQVLSIAKDQEISVSSETELSDAVRALAWKAIAEAHRQLDELPAVQKQKFILAMLTRLAPLLSQQSPAMLQDLRDDMDALTGAIRESMASPDDEDSDDPKQGSGPRPLGTQLGTATGTDGN